MDHPLFWAGRGAGANVGIVTSMDSGAALVPMVVHAVFQYRVDRLVPFLYVAGGGFALGPVIFAGAAERALGPFLRVPCPRPARQA
ncbi:hypothetical protein [Nonomuraea sp. NPDC049129]|uniref:hypothetical protein n=1 Tax=Nonomuraea sp. NPDC049129 TaxID=3155272 RepID=UPI0033FEFA73